MSQDVYLKPKIFVKDIYRLLLQGQKNYSALAVHMALKDPSFFIKHQMQNRPPEGPLQGTGCK